MRVPCFVALLMAVALSAPSSGRAQDMGTPVFRSDTDAVSFEFNAVRKNGPRGTSEPWTTLTIDDLKVVIDGKTYAPTTMTQDKPGHYVLHLIIPDRYRDGKTHKVRFKVKKITSPITHTFTLSKQEN